MEMEDVTLYIYEAACEPSTTKEAVWLLGPQRLKWWRIVICINDETTKFVTAGGERRGYLGGVAASIATKEQELRDQMSRSVCNASVEAGVRGGETKVWGGLGWSDHRLLYPPHPGGLQELRLVNLLPKIVQAQQDLLARHHLLQSLLLLL